MSAQVVELRFRCRLCMPTCSHGASTFPLVNGDLSSSGGELRSSPRRSASLPPSAARAPDMTAAVQLGGLIAGSLAIDGIAVPDPAHRPVTAGERYRLVRAAARAIDLGLSSPQATRGDWGIHRRAGGAHRRRRDRHGLAGQVEYRWPVSRQLPARGPGSAGSAGRAAGPSPARQAGGGASIRASASMSTSGALPRRSRPAKVSRGEGSPGSAVADRPFTDERPSRSRPSVQADPRRPGAGRRPAGEEQAGPPCRIPVPRRVVASRPGHLVVLAGHQRHVRRQGPYRGPRPTRRPPCGRAPGSRSSATPIPALSSAARHLATASSSRSTCTTPGPHR